MKKGRGTLSSAKASKALAAIFEYQNIKFEKEMEDMANRKTAKKKRLKEKRKNEGH